MVQQYEAQDSDSVIITVTSQQVGSRFKADNWKQLQKNRQLNTSAYLVVTSTATLV